MGADVINLRQARKQRERADRRKQADENREKHGRSRKERERLVRLRDAEVRRLDGHWLGQSAGQSDAGDENNISGEALVRAIDEADDRGKP